MATKSRALTDRRLAGDLFKATWFPSNDGIHLIKTIGGVDGDVECGEYVIRPPAPSRFRRLTFTLSPEQLAEAKGRLEALGALRAPTFYEDSEEPRRRYITAWSGGKARTYGLPAAEDFRRLRITRAYRNAFEAAWEAVAGPAETRRQGLNPEDSR